MKSTAKKKRKDKTFRPTVEPFRPDHLLSIRTHKPLAGQLDFWGGVTKPKRARTAETEATEV